MRTYTDEYLNHWADVFVARGLDGYMRLDEFLAAPRLHLARIAQRMYRPLLPAQRRVADEIDSHEARLQRILRGTHSIDDELALEASVRAARAIDHCPRRDGRAIEPLHHHRWHRPRTSFFRPRHQEA